jgi:hypothetical protein
MRVCFTAWNSNKHIPRESETYDDKRVNKSRNHVKADVIFEGNLVENKLNGMHHE